MLLQQWAGLNKISPHLLFRCYFSHIQKKEVATTNLLYYSYYITVKERLLL